jgi:hypothetical protein
MITDGKSISIANVQHDTATKLPLLATKQMTVLLKQEDILSSFIFLLVKLIR